MPVEWALLARWAGTAKSAVGLLDAASAKDLMALMDSIGGVHVRTAARLLGEAPTAESTSARRQKHEAAITHLEGAYTAYTTFPAGVRGVIARWISPKRYARAQGEAAAVAAMLAGGYAALGDVDSVVARLEQGISHLYLRHVSLWMDACSGRPMPFDVAVSWRLAHEHEAYLHSAMKIAEHIRLDPPLRQPARWPHERDPRLRQRSAAGRDVDD